MNLKCDYQTKNIHTLNRVYIWIISVYILISVKYIRSYKFIYSFREDTNSDILFFRENQEKMTLDEEINNDYMLEIIHSDNIKHLNAEKAFFKYSKNNFVGLEELNIILSSNTTNNQLKKGIIKSSYELSYILKLTNDITEIPININNHQFICILTTLKYLKAIENNSMVKLLQALIFKTFVYKPDKETKRKTLIFKKMFEGKFFSRLEFFTMKNFLFAFLNTFMIKYIFDDGNLILLDKSRESYDTFRLLNEHIPYKNICMNGLKILYKLGNILKNRNTLYTFQGLLNYFTMTSFVLDNQQRLSIPVLDFNFFIFSINIFKSITILSFNGLSSVIFLDKLSAVIRNDIEFLSLRNIQISRNALIVFLNQKQLKGLILRNVSGIENIDFIQDYTDSSKGLEYIDFYNVALKSTWWNYFLHVANVRKVILSFSTLSQQNVFMREFSKIFSDKDVLYLEINFCVSMALFDFFISLFYFRSLRILKIHAYKNDSENDSFFLGAIKNMKVLECLEFRKLYIGRMFYDYLFQRNDIKVLRLENIVFNSETPLFNSINDNKSLRKLVLTKIEISSFGLMQIFKLESLLDLTLDSCVLHKIPLNDLQYFNFRSKKINILNFNNTNLQIFNETDILNDLHCLESLNLSKCMVLPVCLARISSECNFRLKRLFFGSGTLNSHNLQRIKNFEFLEELYFSECIFNDRSFCKLGDDCKFFYTLKILNLSRVNLNLEDLIYLRNFKKLKKLYLTLSGLNLQTAKNHLIILPMYFLCIVTTECECSPKFLLNHLYEESRWTILI